MGIQKKQNLKCRECGADYVGHHLTRECDDCRFKECAAPGCDTKIKKSVRRKYCCDDCRTSDPQAKKMSLDKRVSGLCECGKMFPRYRNGSRQRYCSPKCRAQYTHVGDRLRNNPELAAQIGSRPKPDHGLKGYRQTKEHLRKRFGNGSIRPSKEELSLVPTLAKHGYRHTGDGTFWRNWPDGSPKNPDFVNEDKRAIVEYFGFCWHEEEWEKEDYIHAQWKAIGYDCLILWDSDREAFIDNPDFWNLDEPETWMHEVRHQIAPEKKGTSSWAPRGEKKLKEAKTKCSRGHLLTPPNLRKRNHRECLACHEGYLILRHQKRLDLQQVSDACYREIVDGSVNPFRRTKSEAQEARVVAGTHHSTSKTRCPLGHLLQEPNLDPYTLKKGGRKCLSCDKAWGRIRYHGGNKKEIAEHHYRQLGMDDPTVFL